VERGEEEKPTLGEKSEQPGPRGKRKRSFKSDGEEGTKSEKNKGKGKRR